VGDGGLILDAASWIVPLVVAIVLHEISHGWVAALFGDTTARSKGRLSLNPLRHVDPVGTVGLPLVLALAGAPIFGWAKPVPVVARRMRHPRRDMMLVALAGPGMNLLLAVLGALSISAIGLPQAGDGLASLFLRLALIKFVAINIFLAVFNMLPLPPFDGGHVVEGLLPRRLAVHYAKLHRVALPLFIGLLLILPAISPKADIVDRLVRPPVDWLTGTLLGG